MIINTMNQEGTHIVYVLSNEAMPALVKIGRTSQEPEQRLRNLYTTGVPLPFKCEYACYTSHPVELEAALHKLLASLRVNPAREFFRISPENILPLLRMLNEKSDERALTEVNRALGREEDAAALAAETRLRQAHEEEQHRRKRCPNLDFTRMHIPEGAAIEFTKGEQRVTAQIAAPRKVLYEHQEYSLTELTRQLLPASFSGNPLPYWTYQGRTLQEIYDETYPFAEE